MEDGVDLELIANASLSDVIERAKKLLRLSSDIDYIALVIGVALSYIIDILPSGSRIFYVGFVGSKGSGKSTATSGGRVTSAIEFNGKVRGDGL